MANRGAVVSIAVSDRPGLICSTFVAEHVINSWLMDMHSVLVHHEDAIPGADRFVTRETAQICSQPR